MVYSYTIRRATLDDVPHLVRMGGNFIRLTKYAQVIRANIQAMETAAEFIIQHPDGVVLMLVNGDLPVGMLGLLVHPHLLSGERFAAEMFWWVEPDYRGQGGPKGGGRALLEAGEQWARENGAVAIHMIAPDDTVGRLYGWLGYEKLETCWHKQFDKETV